MKTLTRTGVILLTIAGLSSTAFASIDLNLKYGQRNTEVSELQDFLIDKGVMPGVPTGFFGLMTLKAVKAYQKSLNLPPTGYVGILTRQKINEELAEVVASSIQAELNETGTTTATRLIVTVPPIIDVCKNIEGTQTMVPAGMLANSDGNCFVPVVNNLVITQTSAPQPNNSNQNQPSNQTEVQTNPPAQQPTSPGSNTQEPSISVKRGPGFLSRSISPNTKNVQIGNFVVQGDSSVSLGVLPTTISLEVTGYPITNISNIVLKEGSGNLLTTILNPTNGPNSVNSMQVMLPRYGELTFRIYADIGNAESGSVKANMSFGNNLTSTINTTSDGVAIYTSSTTNQ